MGSYTVTLTLEVDPSATFLGTDEANNADAILDQISMALYDIDDMKVEEIYVEKL